MANQGQAVKSRLPRAGRASRTWPGRWRSCRPSRRGGSAGASGDRRTSCICSLVPLSLGIDWHWDKMRACRGRLPCLRAAWIRIPLPLLKPAPQSSHLKVFEAACTPGGTRALSWKERLDRRRGRAHQRLLRSGRRGSLLGPGRAPLGRGLAAGGGGGAAAGAVGGFEEAGELELVGRLLHRLLLPQHLHPSLAPPHVPALANDARRRQVRRGAEARPCAPSQGGPWPGGAGGRRGPSPSPGSRRT